MTKHPIARVPRFECVRTGARAFHWRLRGSNGEIICHSESFTRKRDCRRATETAWITMQEVVWPVNQIDEMVPKPKRARAIRRGKST